MGVVVNFNYQQWIARYPEFAYIPQTQAQEYFNEATLYCRNDGGGPVRSAIQQSILLNMLTAHIAFMNAPTVDGQASSSIVGRIQSATQGSVSVATQNDYPPGTAQWYQQTKYGAAYWEATKWARTMRYLPGPQRRFQPWPYQ